MRNGINDGSSPGSVCQLCGGFAFMPEIHCQHIAGASLTLRE